MRYGMFKGKEIDESMTKDELLEVISWLVSENESNRKFRDENLDALVDLELRGIIRGGI